MPSTLLPSSLLASNFLTLPSAFPSFFVQGLGVMGKNDMHLHLPLLLPVFVLGLLMLFDLRHWWAQQMSRGGIFFHFIPDIQISVHGANSNQGHLRPCKGRRQVTGEKWRCFEAHGHIGKGWPLGCHVVRVRKTRTSVSFFLNGGSLENFPRGRLGSLP